MRFRRLPASALTGLATLALACSGADDAATSPDPTVAARLDAGPAALGLFGLPGRGVGAPGLACRRQPYRQFDFWVGRWEVTVPGRPSTSANIVTSEVGGCAVFEEWHAANGTRGRSMNVYDASDGQWHQHWVENFGFFPLRLDGGLVGGAMVMTAPARIPSGAAPPSPTATPGRLSDPTTCASKANCPRMAAGPFRPLRRSSGSTTVAPISPSRRRSRSRIAPLPNSRCSRSSISRWAGGA